MRNTTDKQGTRLATTVRTMVFVILFDLLTFSSLYILERRASATDNPGTRRKVVLALVKPQGQAHSTYAEGPAAYRRSGREGRKKIAVPRQGAKPR